MADLMQVLAEQAGGVPGAGPMPGAPGAGLPPELMAAMGPGAGGPIPGAGPVPPELMGPGPGAGAMPPEMMAGMGPGQMPMPIEQVGPQVNIAAQIAGLPPEQQVTALSGVVEDLVKSLVMVQDDLTSLRNMMTAPFTMPGGPAGPPTPGMGG